MFKFPQGLYTDVRIEDVSETKIMYTMGSIEESRVRQYRAAFIRVFDGGRWYYCATSDMDNIQQEIDTLASYGKPDENINDNPVVRKLQANTGKYIKFDGNDVSKIAIEKKQDFLKRFSPVLASRPLVKLWRIAYIDKKVVKEFYSSKGANLSFDIQTTGAAVRFSLVDGDKKIDESLQQAYESFDELGKLHDMLLPYIEKCEYFVKNSTPITPGKYTLVLSPMTAGVFAHESFGHKSESDFMTGDETMRKEWAIGKKVGSDILSIIDDGSEAGTGYIPFDDEGTKAEKTYLIEDGVLKGRLHSASTAADLDEDVTGNARAINFEFEPIVRMTTTYIAPGLSTKDKLIEDVEEGIFVDTIKHGSGMSTFTIAPSRCYMIRNGKIAEPVNVSVITGNVMETLGQIDGVSDIMELVSSVTGGCGKNEQYPLPVGFGGPYVRVKNMNVQ